MILLPWFHLVVRLLGRFDITVVLPNGDGLALVPHTVFPIEALEMGSDRADRNTQVSCDLLVS
jgi:hypothetical protein